MVLPLNYARIQALPDLRDPYANTDIYQNTTALLKY